MSRLIGIAFLALAAWAGAELYTKGFDGAFGRGADDPVRAGTPLEEVERVQTLGRGRAGPGGL